MKTTAVYNYSVGEFYYKMEEQRIPKHDWKLYFRVESFKRQGKGTVWRVVRIRDNHIIHRLIKSERKAINSVDRMILDEVRIVEQIVERTILG